jgi:zinc finger protein
MPDYNDLLLNNLKETDLTCLNCGGSASLKYLKLEGIEPVEVISVFECKKCLIKETNFFNSNRNEENLIRIECNFNSKEDLKRQIYLNKNTNLEINNTVLNYSFESSESNIYTVEGIILQAIKNLNSNEGFSTIKDKDKLREALIELEKILENPEFKLIIEDPVGLSRVGPEGVDLFKIQNKEMEYYDDEKVKHMRGG